MTTSSRAKLKSAIIRSVGDELSAWGFYSSSPKETFVRKLDGVTDIFQLVFLDGKPGWVIQPNVAVRIERVEEIFHQSSGFEVKFQGSTPTIGASVGVLLREDARACEFRVVSESDVLAAANGVIEIFKSFALNYFERFGSIAAIDQELNDRPCERTPNRAVPWLRYSSGIIVAKLVNRANFSELEACYNDALQKISGGFYAARFRCLLDYLRSM